MAYIVSFHASSVHQYRVWFILFHLLLHWFIIIGYGLKRFTSCFTGSSLLGIICIISLHASLVEQCRALVELFNFPLWFFLTGHGLYYFISYFHGSSLMVIVVLFHFMLQWALMELFHSPRCFFLAVHGLHFFISCFSGSSMQGIGGIVSLSTLFLPCCSWVAFFHFMLLWFLLTGNVMVCIVSLDDSLVYHCWSMRY